MKSLYIIIIAIVVIAIIIGGVFAYLYMKAPAKTPSATPLPTSTPIPTPTPVVTPTPTPIPTPTPVISGGFPSYSPPSSVNTPAPA